MGRILITRPILGHAGEELERAGHTVETWPGPAAPTADDLQTALAGCDGAITMVADRIDASLLAACPRLRVVANMAVGFDNFDLAAGEAAGVWMTNTPGVLAETTADLAFALLMSAARRVAESDRDTRAGGWKNWSPTAFLGVDVHGATLGIIGLGEIGQAMARRGRGFGMRILYCGRAPKPEAEAALDARFVPLEALLRGSDFVSVHVPLTPETRQMIGAQEFGLMKRSGIFVNTARGQIVDQAALVAALTSGRILAAGLDVTEPEPLPADSPLLRLANVTITPHIGSASAATRTKMAAMAAANILAVLGGGEPVNPLNRPRHPR